MGSLAFLGTGFYFWEDNLDLARWWGVVHCDSQYIICQADIECAEERYLDLVGNVRHLRYLRELKARFGQDLKREFGTVDVPLGNLIEYLRRQDKKPAFSGIFPFTVIRAVDHYRPGGGKILFAQGKDNFTDLSPRIILSLLKKNEHISNFRIIFPEKYV
ncbi:MAG: hypothetical protein ACOYW3_13775 [Bacteroidota bacterium]